ncbi:MAG: hypothetical protein U9O98_09110 [Asgard group archaeon]|nr:hypothetical protein [Asgard group archaeon]
MDIRTISSHDFIPVIDPIHVQQSPDEFLAENGGFLDKVAVIGKSTSGFVHFRSSTAPTYRETDEFFSNFASIADSIGIKVYAYINALADSFLANNPGYSAIKDGGNPNKDFVCPTKDSYINYLDSVVSEVLSFPVQGVILENVRYPGEDFSFRETTTRDFSDAYGIDRIFSLNDLQQDSRIYEEWLKWRREKIEKIIQSISEVVTNVKNTDYYVTIDIDPTLKGEKGALRHFGQDIYVIQEYAQPIIHLSAWTPLPSSPESVEFQQLMASLEFVKTYKETADKPINLYLWGIETEEQLNIIDIIIEEITFNSVFVQNHFPSDYQKRREIHLGIG